MTIDSLAGRTIAWRFDDGPMAGTNFEHLLAPDGSITWRVTDGPHKGASAREKSYMAEKVNDATWVVSYISAAGHTLTVVLSLDVERATAFASDSGSWFAMHGRFRFVEEGAASS